VACLPYSYCLSDVVNSNTSNAASQAHKWVMRNILPDQTGLTIQGVFHRYKITKDASTNSKVHITNKDNNSEGYIYFDPIASSLGTRWGEGEIKVVGDGTLSDVTILYQYRFDPCFIPLSDPTCPDFKTALYQYLLDNDLLNQNPDVNDPYYDEWLKLQQEQQAEAKELEAIETEKKEEEEKEELNMEIALSVAGAAEKIADPSKQMNMMQELAASGKLVLYANLTIDGGTYQDTVQLEDNKISDNYRVLRKLAQDSNHKNMVLLQYKD
jgi:hypothetical protein